MNIPITTIVNWEELISSYQERPIREFIDIFGGLQSLLVQTFCVLGEFDFNLKNLFLVCTYASEDRKSNWVLMQYTD